MRRTSSSSLSIGLCILATFTLALLAGCSKDSSGPALGTMRVQMTDSPASYDAINLVVRQVAAHFTGVGADSNSGWEVLKNDSATYDLLALQNAVFTTIGMARVPAGTYDQVRLKLGPGSTIVVDGTTYPLVVPSGLQSGLKLIGPFTVPANGILDLALDFDAERSIVLTGSGTYLLKPVVKIMAMPAAGAISGKVSPAGTATSIFAIVSTDTLGTATAAGDGSFTVSVLPAGTYSVAFHPASGYRDTTLTGVVVTSGHTTDVGTVQLTAQ